MSARRLPTFSFLLRLAGAGLVLVGLARGASAQPFAFPEADVLPEQGALADPFVMANGERVRTRADWEAQRRYLKAMLAHYLYGEVPPRPNGVEVEDSTAELAYDGAALRTTFQLRITRNGESAAFRVGLLRPLQGGPFPVIIKNDHWRFRLAEVANPDRRTRYREGGRDSTLDLVSREAIRRGYVLCKFVRTDVAPDDMERPEGGVLALYPDYDGGAIAAWAWAYGVLIDYLEGLPFIDADQIVATGHSRGGKAALAAGIYDERIALTAPNSSGSGGTGSWRHFDPEQEPQTLRVHWERHRHWWAPRLFSFVGQEERMPFDAHTAKALVAPRALLNTHARHDYWANPYGTYLTHLAAEPVFRWLGVPEHLAVHWRDGGHDQGEEDWLALFDYADLVFFGKPTPRDFNASPFPEAYDFGGYPLPKPPDAAPER